MYVEFKQTYNIGERSEFSGDLLDKDASGRFGAKREKVYPPIFTSIDGLLKCLVT
jgi:hypothetical protein